MEEPSPQKPPEIREKPRTACAVFAISVATGIGMYCVARLIFDPADERGMSMQFLAMLIGLVGMVWFLFLMARSMRVIIDRIAQKDEAEAVRINNDTWAGSVFLVISVILAAIVLYSQIDQSSGFGCFGLFVAGFGITWSIKMLVRALEDLKKNDIL